MCVWNTNVQKIKFNVLGGNLLVGRPVLSILLTGVVFRESSTSIMQHNQLYSVLCRVCMYNLRLPVHVQQGQRFKRKITKKNSLSISTINTEYQISDLQCHLTAAVPTKKAERMPL